VGHDLGPIPGGAQGPFGASQEAAGSGKGGWALEAAGSGGRRRDPEAAQFGSARLGSVGLSCASQSGGFA
jgi:hypothetical protein